MRHMKHWPRPESIISCDQEKNSSNQMTWTWQKCLIGKDKSKGSIKWNLDNKWIRNSCSINHKKDIKYNYLLFFFYFLFILLILYKKMGGLRTTAWKQELEPAHCGRTVYSLSTSRCQCLSRSWRIYPNMPVPHARSRTVEPCCRN
jgi:hypothetical protein